VDLSNVKNLERIARPDAIEPVDGYVESITRRTLEQAGYDVAHKAPLTRKHRVIAALAIADEHFGFYSTEIMAGRRIDSDEVGRTDGGTSIELTMILTVAGSELGVDHFDGFAHQFSPID